MMGSNRTPVRVTWILGLALIAGCAAPGAVIRGTLGNGSERGNLPAAAYSEAILYVDSLPPGAAHSKARTAIAVEQLTIASSGFAPHEVVIARGDSLAFANRDQRWHSPFSVSPPRRFELGALAPGKRRVLRFSRSGAVRVFCKLHSEPSAIVFVAPTAIWAHPDATGAFTLPGLPPGEYDLRLWHPRYGERRWHVTLPRRGVELQLSM